LGIFFIPALFVAVERLIGWRKTDAPKEATEEPEPQIAE